MIYEDSPVAYHLYSLHKNDKMGITEKIKEVTEKYKILKHKEKWDTLKNFFENPIYVKISYYCETYSNFGKGTLSNEYIRSDISHEEAVKGNIYFYILLSIIGGENDVVAYSANYLTSSEKSEQYLYEYGEEHNLQYESDGREIGKYLIRIMHRDVSGRYGHNIYECIELPI